MVFYSVVLPNNFGVGRFENGNIETEGDFSNYYCYY